jgi:uncharacterized ParB-like nuclease family protein
VKTKKTAAKAVKKNPFANETDAQTTKRLGPSRKIVRFAKKGKTTRVAFRECGHKRSVDLTKRTHVRCRNCRPDVKARAAKRAAKLKKAA